MRFRLHLIHIIISVLPLLFGVGCAPLEPSLPAGDEALYVPEHRNDLVSSYAPVFLVADNHLSFNRIGKPSAQFDSKGKEKIFVDPDAPVLYYQIGSFRTAKGNYRNLVYRIHFEEVPFGPFPGHLNTGKNVGLFVLITLDDHNRPLLVTTVNTCGCYLAFAPTSLLPQDAYPPRWHRGERQKIYGESLPALLDYPSAENGEPRLAVFLRSATHRVMDLKIYHSSRLAELREVHDVIETPLLPIAELYRLSLGDEGFTSFFETEGPRRGFVKGSGKPLERLFMSWWVFSWRIGEDKGLCPNDNPASRFFTSLKFWARADSNMWDFPRFLKYWGWSL